MEDKLKTVNAPLVKAMDELRANENAATLKVFIEELMNSKLIIPAIIKPEPVDGKIAKGSRISFFSVKTKDKESVIFLFTDADELQKWAPAKGKHLILQNYKQFKSFVIGKDAQYDGIVINPYGNSVIVRKDLMEKVEAVTKPMQVQKATISVAEEGLQASEYASPGLFAALCEAMLRNETVNAAWMMQTKRKGEKNPTPILVVDLFKGGDMQNTFNSLARVANDFLAPGEKIGIMSALDRAALHAIKDVQPFYVKGKWGVESHLN